MKRTLRILSLWALLGCISAPGAAYALDPPHNTADPLQKVNCANCHFPSSTLGDDLCLSCHNPVNMTGKYGVVQTHQGTGFAVSCRMCHNPHYQSQASAYPAEGHIITGITTSIGTNTLRDSSAPFGAVNSLKDLTLIPNLSYPTIMYRIAGNTADTITVEGTIRGGIYAGAGRRYAVKYGKMVRHEIATPNSGKRQVKFFTSAENVLNNFADGLPRDPVTGRDTVVNGVCQVCHTRTTSFRNDGTLLGGNHPADQVGSNCVTCHNHATNFSPSCTSCHGNPPVDSTIGGPTGLARNDANGVTNSTTPGAHNEHVNTHRIDCATCHLNSVGSGATHNNGDLKVTLGFSLFSGARPGGSYNGQTAVTYNSSEPNTTVSSGGALTCSNIYCHSTVQSGANGTGAPVYATPSWTNTPPNNVQCGSCHRADGSGTGTVMDSGSHTAHLSLTGYGVTPVCATCHKDAGPGSTIHVNNEINMGFDTRYGGTYSQSPNRPGDGYGTCATTYCHSTGQSLDGASATPVYAMPRWGDAATGECGTCHAAITIATGSHSEHLGAVGVSGCGDCHTGAANNASSYASANHINKLIDVSQSYTAGGEPGNGYGTCATLCHNNALNTEPGITPQWGTTVPACSACHAAIPSTGSHTKHLSTTTYAKSECGDCHNGTVAGQTAPTTHLDSNIDVFDVTESDLGYPANKGKGTAYSTCSTAYCHSTGQSTTNGNSAVPTYAVVTWGGTAPCGSCHKVTEATGLTSGSHAQHLGAMGVAGCGDCHTGAANDASAYDSTSHVNRLIDVSQSYTAGGAPGNGYGTCATLCHNNALNTEPGITPQWGATVPACSACHPAIPTTGSHPKHLASGSVCGDCHADAVAGTTAPVTHLDSNIDVYAVSPSDLGYPQNKAKGTAYGSCSTAYCHSNGLGTYRSATWGGTTTGCSFCHAALPTSGAHADHVKTPATAYGSTSVSTTGGVYDFGCGNCHPVSTLAHINGTLDITLNKNHGGTLKSKNNVSNDTSGYTVTAGPPRSVTCSAAYCHSKGDGTFTVTSPDWYGTFTGDTCGHCHGNQPDTNAHAAHAVAIHYTDIYSGGTGKIASSGGVGSGAAHGDPNTSTTISCNMCHYETVTTSANDKNTACVTCHTGSNLKGNATIALGSTKHLDGSPTVAFNAVNVKSKAQIRNDITTVKELNDSWARTNGYKAAANSHDAAKNALNTATMWMSSTKTCSNISCHNGYAVSWTSSATTSCSACHKTLP